jgi:hypothetical protein
MTLVFFFCALRDDQHRSSHPPFEAIDATRLITISNQISHMLVFSVVIERERETIRSYPATTTQYGSDSPLSSPAAKLRARNTVINTEPCACFHSLLPVN